MMVNLLEVIQLISKGRKELLNSDMEEYSLFSSKKKEIKASAYSDIIEKLLKYYVIEEIIDE